MKRWTARLGMSLLLAAFAALLAATMAGAGSARQQPPPATPSPIEDCGECHWEVYSSWRQSAHGQGLSCGQCHLSQQQDGHAREGHGAQSGPKACMSCHTTGYDPDTDTWQEDNVHCTACHSPVPGTHPDDPAPIDRSADLCGKCHIEARFEWDASRHGEVGVTCVSCHSQHATGLRAKSISEECASCHGERVAGFAHSEHSEQGLSCADCHLAPLEGPIGEGSAKRNHTFTVELKTCTACHSYGLHHAMNTPTPIAAALVEPPGPLDPMTTNVSMEVSAEPQSVNPLTLAAAVGAFSLILGLILAPRLDWFYRLVRGKSL